MNSSLYIGATGMKSLSEGMSVITNNLSNVNTVGYKQQDIQFSDLIYQAQGNIGEGWEAQEDSKVALGQMGMGVQVDSVRTIFTQGHLELGSSVTDLALNGGGFFQVSNTDGDLFYTRAGNFYVHEDGFLQLPSEETLMGFPIDQEGNRGGIEPINLLGFEIMEAKPSTELSLGFNLGNISDSSQSTTDPFFTLAQNYDATSTPPLAEGSYSFGQDFSIINSSGQSQALSLYVDGTPDTTTTSNNVMEFLIAAQPYGESSGEALLSGTLTFDATGNLIDMSAFTPTGDTTDLANWVPSSLVNGKPSFNLNGQEISFDFGLIAGGEMSNLPASAADVGTDATLLGTMGTNTISDFDVTTAAYGSNALYTVDQDGYGEGYLTHINIEDDGTIVGSYSNTQSADLYQIPVARFTSDDGLRREGGNVYTYTDEAGVMTLGTAGSENFGSIHANYLEGSNVDMSAEMVDMIVTQRGFQSNSKVVTTADEMLKKALELKR